MNPEKIPVGSQGGTSEEKLSPEELKDRRDFRHEVFGEFRKVLGSERRKEEKREISENTEGVVILSCDGFKESKDTDIENPNNPNREDVARIDFAFQLWKDLIVRKLNKPLEKITKEDLEGPETPPLILDGIDEQLPYMKEVFKKITEKAGLEIPQEKIILIDCGSWEKSDNKEACNTKTQFTGIVKNPAFGGAKHLTFVSSNYHVPRVARTGSANLPEEMDFDTLGVPLEKYQIPLKLFRRIKGVRGEVKRIEKYSDPEKSDISRYPREKK